MNFHGDDPRTWVGDLRPVADVEEAARSTSRSRPTRRSVGAAYIGMEHVWRTDDHGGPQAFLEEHCNALHRDAGPCGDWEPMGRTSTTARSQRPRRASTSSRSSGAPTDRNTMWVGTRIGRLWCHEERGRGHPRNVELPADRHRCDSPDGSCPGSRSTRGTRTTRGSPTRATAPTHPGRRSTFEARFDPKTRTARPSTDRSYDLGDQPVTGIAHNDANGDLYAATDFGVMRLPRGGTSWLRAGTAYLTASRARTRISPR